MTETSAITAPNSEPAVETRGLRRLFGDHVAVDGLDISVPRRSFYGFLGPNGAGKSTTIKCLTGLLAPSAGELRILGLDAVRDELEIKRRIGVVPEDLALFARLTGGEHLALVGRVHGLSVAQLAERSAELLVLFDLESAAAVPTSDYSHGMKKKLALALALLPAPQLLFLDEPFEGVDAVAAQQIKSLLTGFVAHGGTVFLTSHVLEIVERLCDHVGIIAAGRLVAQGPLAELRGGAATLEQRFLELVGASGRPAAELDWLHA
ncbi:MAG: ABC transporter ATP-binding protein [Acidobacteriota bacterium]